MVVSLSNPLILAAAAVAVIRMGGSMKGAEQTQYVAKILQLTPNRDIMQWKYVDWPY